MPNGKDYTSSVGGSVEHSAVQDSSAYNEFSPETFQYDHQQYVPRESHHLSPSFAGSQVIEYPPEIMIEEEQPPQISNGQGNQPTYSSYNEVWPTTDHKHYDQSYTQHSDQISSTTRRWSMQQLPEERLRLGLTRWGSKEQKQAAYQHVLHRS